MPGRSLIATAAAAATALLAVLAPTAQAEINVGESLDWLVVSRAAVVIRRGEHAEKVLKGTPPDGLFSPGAPKAGASPRELVFVNAEGTIDYRIDLDDPKTDRLFPALTPKFEVLDSAEGILAHVQARIDRLKKDGKAERAAPAAGGEKAANVHAAQRGFLRFEVPADTAAFRALWSGSSCYLIVPADPEYRAPLLARAREAKDVWERARAAVKLLNYDGDDVRGLLRGMLTDPDGATVERDGRATTVFPTRHAAWETLRALGEEHPKPAGWDEDFPRSFLEF